MAYFHREMMMRWSGVRMWLRWLAGCVLLLSAQLAAASTAIDSQQNSNTPFSTSGQQNTAAQSIDISGDDLGWTGPFTFSLAYSDLVGAMVDLGYSRLFGHHHHKAYAGKLELGAKQNRFNLTFADEINARQRFKFSVERLAQQRDFDFNPGPVTSWVSQYAAGLSYQFQPVFFQHGHITVNGYYAQSHGKSLSSYAYCVYIDGTCIQYENLRHIAGATVDGVSTDVAFQPFKSSLLSLGVSYDQLKYASLYQLEASNASGIGYQLSWRQRLWSTGQFNLTVAEKKTEQDLSAALQWLYLTSARIPINVALSVAQIKIPNSVTDRVVQLSLNGSFTQSSRHRLESTASLWQTQLTPLRQWVTQPSVYMPEVYASVDQQQREVSINWCGHIDAVAESASSELLTWCAAYDPALQQRSHLLSSNQPHVLYHLVVTDQSPGNSGATIFSGDVSENHFDLKHLHPHGTYKAVVTAKDDQGYKPITAQTTFTTDDSEITWSDHQLTLASATRSSIAVAWHANAVSNDEDDTLIYTARLSHNGQVVQSTQLKQPKLVDQVTPFDGLQPHQAYSVQVEVTDTDRSPAKDSTILNATTSSDRLTWSDNAIQLSNIDRTAVTVDWHANASSTDPKDSLVYHVIVTDDAGHPVEKQISEPSTINQQTKITGLLPGVAYHAHVLVTDTDLLPAVSSTVVPFQTTSNHMQWSDRVVSVDQIQRAQATVHWDANAVSNDPADVLTYTVLLSDHQGQQLRHLVTAPSQPLQSFTFTDLLPGHDYTAQVTLTDRDSLPSMSSEPVPFQTTADHFNWPDQNHVEVSDIYASHLSVDFIADAALTNPSDSVSYLVEVKNVDTGKIISNKITDLSGKVTTKIDNILPQQRYSVTVKACDQLHQFSDLMSNVVSAQNQLVWPQSRSVEVGSIAATSAAVSWKLGATDSIPDAVIDYHAVLYDASGEAIQQLKTTAGDWQLQGLQANQHYFVKVTAEDDRGLAVHSNKLFFQTQNNAILWPNPNIKVNVFANMASVSWNAAAPPASHQGSTLIYYHVTVTGKQSGHLYYRLTQLPLVAGIAGFIGFDSTIIVKLTASDNAGDVPVTISEAVPIGQAQQHFV